MLETSEATLRSEAVLMPLVELSSKLSFYKEKRSGCESALPFQFLTGFPML